MADGSIRWRLFAAAVLAIAASLVLSAIGLTILFDRQVTRLAMLELQARSATLVAGLDQNDLLSAPPDRIGGDPRYLQPYSGLYWQIEIAARTYRSQSLWDTVLPVRPTPPDQGATTFYEASGPDRQRLLVLERSVRIGPEALPLRVSVAESRTSLEEAQALFKRDLLPFLIGLGALMTAGSVAQVAIGLRPFARVRRQIEEMNRGLRSRLGSDQPKEVLPLATAIDELLEDRDKRIARARTRATDLAHTLKTPLQALLGETGRLRQRGEGAAADMIDEIVEAVRTRVDRELARSRIGSGGATDLRAAARKVAKVLERTALAETVRLSLDVPSALMASIDENDLIEALGSIAENAMRHATKEVRITARGGPGHVDLSVADDGKGVPAALLSRISERGVRFDDTLDGTGLGLSLAHEIVEAAGGKVIMENLSPGFRVTFRLQTPE